MDRSKVIINSLWRSECGMFIQIILCIFAALFTLYVIDRTITGSFLPPCPYKTDWEMKYICLFSRYSIAFVAVLGCGGVILAVLYVYCYIEYIIVETYYQVKTDIKTYDVEKQIEKKKRQN
jgi:hypothetical protein